MGDLLYFEINNNLFKHMHPIFSKEEIIAEIAYGKEDVEVLCVLSTDNDIEIKHKGKVYYDPKLFPEDLTEKLKKRLKNGEDAWIEDDDTVVDGANKFVFSYKLRIDGIGYGIYNHPQFKVSVCNSLDDVKNNLIKTCEYIIDYVAPKIVSNLRRNVNKYKKIIAKYENNALEIQKYIDQKNEILNTLNNNLASSEKKHKYNEINSEIQTLEKKQTSEHHKMNSARFIIVLECINSFFNHEYFKNGNINDGWNYLFYKYKIMTESSNCSFEHFLNEMKDAFISNGNNFIADKNHYKCDTVYCKLFYDIYKDNRLDGNFYVIFPIDLIRKLNGFIDDIIDIGEMKSADLKEEMELTEKWYNRKKEKNNEKNL